MSLTTKTALESDGLTEFEMPILPATPGARADMVGIGLSDEDRLLLEMGRIRSNAIIITRVPTTAIVAGDVIGPDTSTSGVVEFTSMGRSGGSDVVIVASELIIEAGTPPSGMGPFYLENYSVTPPSAYVDNAAWDLPSGDRAAQRGMGLIELGTPIDKGSTLYVKQTGLYIPMTLAGTSIFSYLITGGPYTQAGASTVYRVRLWAEQR